jgi:hypothetical protein
VVQVHGVEQGARGGDGQQCGADWRVGRDEAFGELIWQLGLQTQRRLACFTWTLGTTNITANVSNYAGNWKRNPRIATQTATRRSGIVRAGSCKLGSLQSMPGLKGKEKRESLMPASATRRVGMQAAVEGFKRRVRRGADATGSMKLRRLAIRDTC